MSQAELNAELLARIRKKRAQMETFLATSRPRKRRLLNTTIFGGSLAAALTAAPAIGGQSFTAWLTVTLGQPDAWNQMCSHYHLSGGFLAQQHSAGACVHYLPFMRR